MNPIDIARMDKTEKLQAMEAIWDSLVHDATELESPDWHRDVLVERTNRHEQGKGEFFTIDEIRSRLRK